MTPENEQKRNTMITRHECIGGKIPLKVYLCTAGFPTVGIGHKLPVGTKVGSIFTMAQANKFFLDDLAEAERCIKAKLLFGLDEIRVCALVDMAFNLGCGGISKFVDMFAALKIKNYGFAAEAALDSAWARQVGNRAKELAAMVRTGEWQM